MSRIGKGRYFEPHLTGIVEFLEVGKVEKWLEASTVVHTCKSQPFWG